MNNVLKPNQKKFWSCPKKAESRRQAIIGAYRALTGERTIKPPGQYWTMCGQMSAGLEVTEGSELRQLIDEGLLEAEEQFVGVELNPDIHEMNDALGTRATLRCGDICTVMRTASAEGWLQASMVNLDMISGPERGSRMVSEIMNIIESADLRCILACNFVLTRPRGKDLGHSPDDVLTALSGVPLFRQVLNRGPWAVGSEAYEYDGTGNRSKTRLATVIIARGYD